eukprot:2236272-Prymnesium_polylepis.1
MVCAVQYSEYTAEGDSRTGYRYSRSSYGKAVPPKKEAVRYKCGGAKPPNFPRALIVIPAWTSSPHGVVWPMADVVAKGGI